MRATVAVVGYASLDHAMQVGTFHGTDGTTLVQRRLSDPWPAHGGLSHVARGLAAAGLRTQAVSWVGPDDPGGAFIAGLREDGIGVRGMVRAGTRSPSCYLFYPEDGGTVCVYDPGDCQVDSLTLEQREIVTLSDWVCVTVGPRVITEAVLACLPASTRLAWAVKSDPDAFPPDLVPRLLARAAVVTFSEAERPFLERSGPLEAQRRRPDQLLVETRGAAGVRYVHRGHAVELPGSRIDDVDTTGAGDRLFASLVAALGRRPDDPPAAVRSAVDATAEFLRLRGANV